MRRLKIINLLLLILYPFAWAAPLLRAGLLPLFVQSEISLLSGLLSLWHSDVFLALIVFTFAFLAPYAKLVGLVMVHFKLVEGRLLPVLRQLGRLAMADIVLIALHIAVAKEIGFGNVETSWGLYLLTGCIMVSFAISHLTARQL